MELNARQGHIESPSLGVRKRGQFPFPNANQLGSQRPFPQPPLTPPYFEENTSPLPLLGDTSRYPPSPPKEDGLSRPEELLDVWGDIEQEIDRNGDLNDFLEYEADHDYPTNSFGIDYGSEVLTGDNELQNLETTLLNEYTNIENEIYCDFDQEEETEEDEVCFGMIPDFSGFLLNPLMLRKGRYELAAVRGSDRTLLSKENSSIVGQLTEEATEVLNFLSNTMRTQSQFILSIQRKYRIPTKPKGEERGSHAIVRLSVILYGPLRNFDEVGEYLDNCEIYLQDPKGCDRNVRYRNPHRLSGLSSHAPFTIDQELCESMKSCERAFQPVDYLAEVDTKTNLPETNASDAIARPLLRHQKQALTFMLEREQGWAFFGQRPDIWKDASKNSTRRYMNTITGDLYVTSPPTFRGGILADQMGLGKTLSMISLVASDFSLPIKGAPGLSPKVCRDAEYQPVNCTLIVVPPSLLNTWENQLHIHLRPASLRWRRHYGNQKLSQRSQLTSYHIILTTFQTVTSEWGRRQTMPSLLFSVTWHRVILDEAHYIRGRNSLSCQATCALEAGRRWAMTGTPIQNSLNDLAALLQFIRVYPYNDPKVFRTDITHLWKTKFEEVAVERLKNLLNSVCLRRSTSTLDLPGRTDMIRYLDFTPNERAKYDAAQNQARTVLDNILTAESSLSGSYLTCLQRINALRLICNIGLASPRSSVLNEQPNDGLWSTTLAHEAFYALAGFGNALCSTCSLDMNIPDSDSTEIENRSLVYISKCARLLCRGCFRKKQLTDLPPKSWCGHSPACPVEVLTDMHAMDSAILSTTNSVNSSDFFSTKIKALTGDIESLRDTKSVVFSFWTSTLDMIEKAFYNSSITFVRVDGKISAKNRIAALESFRNDPHVTVILLTISCGAVGLDLTAANRAYIVEPHWNPTVEEQAFGRIYRMGQTKDVTTIRYIMRDTFEDNFIVRVQKRKKQLVDLLLPQKRLSRSDFINNQIQELRSLLD